jgi:hypothetical protein
MLFEKVEAEVTVESEPRWQVEPEFPARQVDGTLCSLLCPRNPGHLNLTPCLHLSLHFESSPTQNEPDGRTAQEKEEPCEVKERKVSRSV